MSQNEVLRYISGLRSNLLLGSGLSLLALALSFLVRYYTPITLSYVPFYPAILVATIAAGPVVGAVTTVCSAVLAVYFFNHPTGLLAMTTGDVWSLGAFLTVSLLLIATTDFLVKTVIQVREQARLLSAAEQHTRVLLRELSHRMKNQYAIILAMARATSTSATSISEFQGTFAHRLHCLSRTHDLLVGSDWKSVSLESLIDLEMGAFAPRGAFSLEGPGVNLTEIAAVNFGLAVHELATNSARHGAWSTKGGNVNITWRHSGDQFIFDWYERAGPPVEKLGSKGFGRKILEEVAPIALEGSSALVIGIDGLHWNLTAPKKLIVVESPNQHASNEI